MDYMRASGNMFLHVSVDIILRQVFNTFIDMEM